MRLRALAGIAYAETLCLLRNRTLTVIFLAVPLLMLIFLGGVYRDQVIVHIPTVILDLDRSPMSREIIQAIKANPSLEVVGYAADYEQAQSWLKEEKARVAVVIPENLDRRAGRGEPARILTIIDGSNMVFTNIATSATGDVINELAATLRSRLLLSRGLLTVQVQRILTAVQFPVTARYNPAYNYAFFLLFGMAFYILQQTYLLGVATTISREREMGTWVQYRALPYGYGLICAGKLLPYLLTALAQAGLILLGGACLYRLPVHGSAWLLALTTAVFLVTVGLFGILVSALTAKINSVRFTMVMAMPSFILSGFTWPLDAMHPVARIIGECLPLTWYLQAFQTITMKGAGWSAISPYVVNLALISLVCGVLAALALKITDRYLVQCPLSATCNSEQEVFKVQSLRNIASVAYLEWLAITRDKFIIMVLFAATAFYLTLFGLAYCAGILTEIPVAVVDRDHSPASRELVRMLEAHPRMAIVFYPDTIREMDRALDENRVRAAVVIPEDFEKSLTRGDPARVQVIIDGCNLIYAYNLRKAAAEVNRSVGAELMSKTMLGAGLEPAQAEDVLKSIQFVSESRYNPTYNYTYFLFLLLVVIAVQQTCLLGEGLTLAREKEDNTWVHFAMSGLSNAQIFWGKVIPYYLVLLANGGLALAGSHLFLGLPVHGNIFLLWLALALFGLAVVGLGYALSGVFRDTVQATTVICLFNLPMALATGFTWPHQSMAAWVRYFGYLCPATWMTHAARAITMKSAGLNEVLTDILVLAIMAVVFVGLAVLSTCRIRNVQWQQYDEPD